MKISLVSENITVIELSPEEMIQYDFTFEKSDYSSPHTRRVLWEIIDDASRITGKTLEVSKGLEIDFLPDIKGGGLLIICEGEQEKIKGHKLGESSVFQSRDISSFIDFAKCTYPNIQPKSASLYRLGNMYRLCLTSDTKALSACSKEFYLDEITSPYCLQSTKELWECLIESDALKVLSGTNSEK